MTDDLVAANRAIHHVYETVGLGIRAAREHRGLTQQDLATSIGMTRSSVTTIEAGRQQIRVHTLVMIAQALGVHPSELVDGLPAMVSPLPTSTIRLRSALMAVQFGVRELIGALDQQATGRLRDHPELPLGGEGDDGTPDGDDSGTQTEGGEPETVA